MASYKGHIVGGLGAYACGLYLMSQGVGLVPDPWLWARWLLCALVGSLLPDSDISSKGQRLVYGMIAILFFWLIISGNCVLAAYGAVAACIPLLAGHRRIVHTLWFWALVLGLITWMLMSCVGPWICSYVLQDSFFIGLGICSHLWLDGYGHRLFRIS